MKLGFIGCGNMGEAMLKGAISGGFARKEEIVIATAHESTGKKLVETYGVAIGSNNDVASAAEIIVLAVKPNIYPQVLDMIKGSIHENTLIISITTGFTIEELSSALNGHEKIIRTMPNTPALIGKAVTAVTYHPSLLDEEKQKVLAFLNSFGVTIEVEEDHMVGVGSVSGSSPAFIYMLIEAMADGAVKYGLPRNDAYQFAALAVEGAARMVLETGEHPGALKDAVTSPGGTTIEGVIALEKNGFKGNIVEAMEVTAEKFIQELNK